MRRLLLLVVLVGCHPSDMDFPVGGGGGGGGGGTRFTDAAIDGSGSGGTITAIACVLTDARDLTSCRTTGSAGLTVGLGSASATTADDGSFTIARPTVAVLWDVKDATASTVVESVTAFTGQTRIPVIDFTTFADLENINGVPRVVGTGVLLARVTRGGTAVQGETAQLSPLPMSGPFYDPAQPSAPWATQGTGARGTVYFDGVTPGTVTLTLSAAGMTQKTISQIPIADSVATFVFAELP